MPPRDRDETSSIASYQQSMPQQEDIMETNETLSKSPFINQVIHIDVSLLPSQLNNINMHITHHIRSLLLQYNHSVKGVILSFRNLSLLDDAGTICDIFPHINFKVKSDTLLFCPKVGDKLKGNVNACFSTHVSLIVFSLFSVIIREESLVNSGYEYMGYEGWVHTMDDSNIINVGMKMDFVVHKVYACAGSLSIEGRI